MLLQYLTKVIFNPKKGFYGFQKLLSLVSLIYLGIITIKTLSYKKGFFKRKQLLAKVISIGNITVGGTGKTPAIIEIASLLKKVGKKVGILIRGYKGKYEYQQGVVSDGKNYLLTSEEAGDEAWLLAVNLQGIPVLVGRDRYVSGKYAIEKFQCDTILLDDGFQYLRLVRDIDIVLYNVSAPQENLKLLPQGVLREPLAALQRAQIIILTHTEMTDNIEIWKNKFQSINPEAIILESVHSPLWVEDINTAKRYPLNMIKNKSILAISGIAYPESFEYIINQLGVRRLIHLRFPDHYRYNLDIIQKIEDIEERIDIIITTEKDAIRLKEICCKINFPLYFLKIRFNIITPQWENILLRYIYSNDN
jgi:tetraacyldisaccharide 4'-kinase